jgi:FkbM family methyltransferase
MRADQSKLVEAAKRMISGEDRLTVRKEVYGHRPSSFPTVRSAPKLSGPIALPCVHEGNVFQFCAWGEDRHLRHCLHPECPDERDGCARDHPSPKSGIQVCTACPDYIHGANAKTFLRRFDHRSLATSEPGKRFNPSLLPWRDGYLLAWRNGWAGSEIYLSELNRAFKPTGRHQRLHLWHQQATYGREDPRLFMFRGQVHIMFIGVMGYAGRVSHTNVLYARLRNDLSVDQIFFPHYPQRNAWEKNWQFFEHGGELYAVYSIAPHRILKIKDNSATLVHETPTRVPWTGGELRGGASPVRVGDEWYCFFHDRLDPQRLYRAGLYTFAAEPPFHVRRIIKSPILVADPVTRPADQYCPVVFPGGAVLDGDRWVVACGIHDRWAELHAFDRAGLESKSVRCSPPAGWMWRPDGTDGELFSAVNAHDEYGLARFSLAGGSVLDVGGQIGSFVLAAADRGAALIHSYEPEPENYKLLKQNACLVSARATAFCEAVGPVDGRARMQPWRESPEHTGGYQSLTDPDGTVTVTAIDKAISRLASQDPSGRVRLLKLDCEAAEWAILASATRMDLVDIVVGEYHAGSKAEAIGAIGASPALMRSILERLGFRAEIRVLTADGGFFVGTR